MTVLYHSSWQPMHSRRTSGCTAELGVELGGAVREVHRQILRGEMALDPPSGRSWADLLGALLSTVHLGDYRQALTDCTNAMLLQQQLGDPYGQATTWDSLGYIYHHLAHRERAIVCYEASLALRRDSGERYGEARTLIRLGDTRSAIADIQAAREAWQRTAAILEQLHHPDVGLARSRLQHPLWS